MNYYEHHLGDYAKDTSHLTMIEHGAYRLLLDRYYGTEKGIPASQIHRIAQARTKEEKVAVDAVVGEFFELVDGVYINNRAEAEITKAQSKIKSAQENGKRGGRPKKNPDETHKKPSGLFVGYENETQTKAHQTPDTRHQSPVKDIKTHTEIHNYDGTVTPSVVCVELMKLGVAQVNPQHAELLSLIHQGVGLQDFLSAGSMAMEKNKGFSYALGIVKGRLQEEIIGQQAKGKSSGTGRQHGSTSRIEHSRRIGGHLDKIIAEEFGPEVGIGSV